MPEKPRLNPRDRVFFRKLGERIAAFRKEREWTQVQLAEKLGCSQPRLLQFEKGTRRIPVSELVRLAEVLGTSVEDLLGLKKKASKRGPSSKLERQMQRLRELPPSKQRFISKMIDAALQAEQSA